MYDESTMRAELSRDEGRRRFPYKDTEGILTIGVGWNLEANGLPEYVIDYLLNTGIKQAEQDVQALYQEWELLSDVRQRVLINMAFNLGRHRLAGFKDMWAAIHARQYHVAAEEMLDSKWARQVGPRATRLAEEMSEG